MSKAKQVPNKFHGKPEKIQLRNHSKTTIHEARDKYFKDNGLKKDDNTVGKPKNKPKNKPEARNVKGINQPVCSG